LFILPAHDGTKVDLRDVLGQWVLLWWYPRASTPTCTREGSALRDSAQRFEDAGCVVAGVSYDDPQENRAFAEAHDFPFRLLSDVAREVSMSYGTVRAAGEPYDDMPRRWSFLIDPSGRIARTYDVTDPEAHPHHVIADIEAITAAAGRHP
jgi:peroxiredoxin Q/BCP